MKHTLGIALAVVTFFGSTLSSTLSILRSAHSADLRMDKVELIVLAATFWWSPSFLTSSRH